MFRNIRHETGTNGDRLCLIDQSSRPCYHLLNQDGYREQQSIATPNSHWLCFGISGAYYFGGSRE